MTPLPAASAGSLSAKTPSTKVTTRATSEVTPGSSRVPSAFNRFFSPSATLHEEKLVNLGTAIVLLTVYGGVYFFLTDRLGVPEAAAVFRRLRPGEPRPGTAG